MSSRDEIDITYGVNNDFFRLWLDQSMTYTCALFLDGDETLEQAQRNKHQFLSRCAHVAPGQRVLDIGCGWGANLNHIAREEKVAEAVGITLSKDQYEEILARKIPNSTVEYVDYRHYTPPPRSFDAVISIGMFEHVATPEQTRRGEHLDIYRNYFRRAWEWSRPGAWFGLQTVVGGRVPRGSALKEIGWVTSKIFPGAISPRLEAIFESVLPYWEIVQLNTRREHYARTTTEWRARLRQNEGQIRENWGDAVYVEYERYLSACVMAFEEGYQSLAQFSLRRLDR
ncbi:class I SAM-dependent methyltransferase [Hydrocarboniphaga effusa]|uniref:class I SAM-dependent methyltransferase n=1 Tax=Hydrocarboniphaga effusa TaxID=243629 RepID=UPI00398BD421